jgi:hypothetical protein
VIDAAHLARRQHDARRAGHARALVQRSARGQSCRSAGPRPASRRLPAPCRRPGRTACVGWAASPSSVARPKLHWPMGSRSAVAQRFQLLGRSISWRALGQIPGSSSAPPRAAFGDAPLLLLAAVEGDDHVVLLAAAQRVVHQVAVGADPDAGGIPRRSSGKSFSTTARYTTWPETRAGR